MPSIAPHPTFFFSSTRIFTSATPLLLGLLSWLVGAPISLSCHRNLGFLSRSRIRDDAHDGSLGSEGPREARGAGCGVWWMELHPTEQTLVLLSMADGSVLVSDKILPGT